MAKPSRLKVVPVNKATKAEFLDKLEEIRQEVINDITVSMFYVRTRTDGTWTIGWTGRDTDSIRTIGCLEALKWEIMQRCGLDG